MRCPKTRWSVALAGLAVLATACSLPFSGDRPATQQASTSAAPAGAPVQKAPGAVQGAPAAPAAQPQAAARGPVTAALAARWGLAAVPLVRPAAPVVKPELVSGPGVVARAGLPPVVSRVPTTDKVVFLTIDDGAEKDPKFLRMMRELDLPYSSFVSGYLARSDYGYFRQSLAEGNAVHNHTLNHKDLRKLSEAGQRQEICGQQEELEREMGRRPYLFRPPYGEYNETTLRVAASCGVTAIPLWNEEVYPDRVEWRYDHQLKPGDIVLTHYRGAAQWSGDMTDMVRQFLQTATSQGFAVARLEDYI